MIRRFFLAITGCLLCGVAAATLRVEQGDAGQAYQFHTVRASFELVNEGEKELRGIVVKPLRAGDSVVSAPTRLAAGQRANVEVDIFNPNDLGVSGHTFSVASSDSKEPRATRIRVYSLSVLQDPTRILDFGKVAAGDTPTLDYVLATDDPKVRIAAIKEMPSFATAAIKDDGRGLVITHRGSSDWGQLSGFIKLQLDSPQQREAWLPLQTEVRGIVLPSSMRFEFGVARIGQQNEYILQYRQGEGKPFTLARPVIEGFKAKSQVQDCVGGEQGCRQIRFLLDDKQPQGQLTGTLRVHLPDYDRDLLVPVGGMLLSQKIKVQNMDEVLAASAKAAPASETNLGLALNLMKAAEQPVEAAIPPGAGPLLRWSVNNETLIYGYAVYRADSEQGPFLRQGAIVRKSAAAKPDVTSNYAFRDNETVAGTEYWYRIATLYADGRREFLGTAQRVTAAAGETAGRKSN